MVKLENAVVAHIAMAGALRPENPACLTELHLLNVRRVAQIHMWVGDAVVLRSFHVLVNESSLSNGPLSRWYDAWVRGRTSKCLDAGGYLKIQKNQKG